MPTVYELIVHTSAAILPHILQAIEGHATLVSVKTVEIKDGDPPIPNAPMLIGPMGPSLPMPSVQLSLPTAQPLPAEKPKRVRFRTIPPRDINGVRPKTDDIVVKTLQNGPKEIDAIMAALRDHGLSENSASPAISHTIRDGKVIQTGPRTYALAPKP